MSGSQIVQWPVTLPDCPTNWSEKPIPMIIRSDVQVGVAKTRRRYTRVRMQAQVSFLFKRGVASNKLASPNYLLFRQFYAGDCLGGSRPFFFVHPFSKELKTWRWLEEPTIGNFENKVLQVSCVWEEI